MSHDLHWYAESGQIDRLREALAAGADLEARNEEGLTPLQLATAKGRPDVMEALADAGADLEAAEGAAPGLRPLHRACVPSEWWPLSRNVPMIRLLLEKGARPDARDERGRTALHLAGEWCDSDLLERFVAKGADVTAADEAGRSVLHVVCRRGAVSLADHLLGGASGPPPREDTALSRLEHESVLEILLAEGANPNAADAQGATPLHVAAESGADDAVRILLAGGADPDVADEYGVTALHQAADAVVADRLIERGAALDRPDRDGNTPLHRAVGSGRVDVAEVLLDREADVGVRNRDGKTALYLAAQSGRAHTVEKLIARGADPNEPDQDGRTPLAAAREAGHALVVQTLKRRGGRARKWRSFFGF